MLIEELKVNDEFQDIEIKTLSTYINGENSDITCIICGDHIYTVSNNVDTLVVARDEGNGNGRVLSVTHYNKG
jgi:hypothetical protein